VLRAQGATVREVSLPNLPLSVPTYYVVAPAECSSNLARFDGVRFGHRCENPRDLMDLYERSRGEGFGAEVKRRIMTGTYVLSAGYYDAYYLKAQRVRRLIADDFRARLRRGGRADRPHDADARVRASAPRRRSGHHVPERHLHHRRQPGRLPAISVPCGLGNGLPVGMQLVGAHFAEERMLNVAHRYQRETDWHTRAPEAYR
jgi:aspartyl-tRNA(Asn)/glutamyl-tRNA(Gln) amidotransferase subunit A